MSGSLAAAAAAGAVLSDPTQLLTELARARELLEHLKKMVTPPRLPFALLHELYLEVKFNLAVLDTLPTKELARERTEALGRDPTLQLAGLLRTDALSTLVRSDLEFQHALEEAQDGVAVWEKLLTTPSAQREARWERLADSEDANLLGICTTVLLKIQVTHTLAATPSEATRGVDGWRRLRNVRWLLLFLLRHLKVIVPEKERPFVLGVAPALP